MTQTTPFSCACGQVHLEVEGAPIVNAECCCNSCRPTVARLQTLPSAADSRTERRHALCSLPQGSTRLRDGRSTPQRVPPHPSIEAPPSRPHLLQHAGLPRIP